MRMQVSRARRRTTLHNHISTYSKQHAMQGRQGRRAAHHCVAEYHKTKKTIECACRSSRARRRTTLDNHVSTNSKQHAMQGRQGRRAAHHYLTE